MANRISLITNGNIWELVLDSDPRSGAGFQAPIGSIAFVQDTGSDVGEEYIKFGTGVNDWRNISDEEFDVISMTEQNTIPSAPLTGAKMFLSNVGGRQMQSMRGKSGLSYVLQPHIGKNKTLLWQANGNSTASTIMGGAISANGTATTRSVANTSFFTWLRRLGYVSVASAGSSSGIRTASAQYGRGNLSGVGGFHFITRFGISDAVAVATGRLFVGMTATTSVLANVNPSTLLNLIGVGADSTDTNLQIIHNDGAGVATKIDLGASFPANTRNIDAYELALFCPPNGSSVFYTVTNLTTGVIASGELTTDLPANTTLLAWQLWRNNGTTALAVGLDIVSVYLETDN